MRLRLRLFGHTIASLSFDAGPALEILEETPQGITGGSGHDFERAPETVEEEYWPEERGFGFRC